MAFEPISGTIGFVALVDPAVRAFSFLYGKYKLTKAFGRDYIERDITYRSEVAFFEILLETKGDQLESNPLNGRNMFRNDDIKRRFVLYLQDFEDCDVLSKKYNLQTLETPATPAVIEGTTTEDNGVSTNSEKAKTGARLWIRQHLPFHKRKGRNEVPLDKALTPLQSVQENYQAERNKLSEERSARQKQASPGMRGEWLADRNRFIELLQKLSGHRQYFSSVILMRGYSGKSGAVTQDGIEVPESDSKDRINIPDADRKVGNHLKRLIQTLAAIGDAENVAVDMLVHHDPFALYKHLARMLEVRGKIEPRTAFGIQLRQIKPSATGQSWDTCASLAFFCEIIDGPEEGADYFAANTTINSFDELKARFPELPTELSRRRICQSVGRLCDPPGVSRFGGVEVIHDLSRFHLPKSLAEALKDEDEDELRSLNHSGFRMRLGLVLASTLLHSILAGYPFEYLSEKLRYHSVKSAGAQSLAERRIGPYIPIEAIGISNLPKSSAEILSSAMQSPEEILFHKLGLLLYEIGCWRPVDSVDQSWKSRCSLAQEKTTELDRYTTVAYRNVVSKCINRTITETSTIEDQVAWLFSEVLQPLKASIAGLPLLLNKS